MNSQLTLFTKRLRSSYCATLLALVSPLLVPIQSANGAGTPEVTIPIYQSVLADGSIRYYVTLTIGSSTINAQLDTGSAGLRVLSRAIRKTDVQTPSTPTSVSELYGSCVRLTGTLASAVVSWGAGQFLPTSIPIEVVKTVGCAAADPNCPASLLPQNQYLIGGDGIPGQGFLAILGIGMRASTVPNPLAQIGNGSWIVRLPLPGSGAPGLLRFNTNATSRAPFTTKFQLQPNANGGWADNQLNGCLTNPSGATYCFPTLMDSGAWNFAGHSSNFSSGSVPPFSVGETVSFSLSDDSGTSSSFRFASAATGNGSLVHDEAPGLCSGPITNNLNTGPFPFELFAIFYDAPNGRIGLAPRADGPTPPPPVALAPVYRFYSPFTGEHFFTLNAAEGIAARYQSEGVGFNVFPTESQAATVALYRCQAAISARGGAVWGMHFISTDAGCEGYTTEGLYGYVYNEPVPGTTPLYRFFQPQNGDHLETGNYVEGAANGYVFEGVLGYYAN